MGKLFVSTVVNRVDKKGRVSVPAAFRAVLAEAGLSSFWAFRSFAMGDGEPVIEACGPDRMEAFADELEKLEAEDPGSERYQYVEGVLADMRELSIDADGRINLPSELAIHAGLGEEAAFVGRGKFFYVREPKTAAQAVESGIEMRRKAALARRAAPKADA